MVERSFGSELNGNMSSEINDFQWNESQEESVDPRVQIELERLNTATDLINRLEIELDEARSNFRLLLSESSQKINQLTGKLGSCIEKARPYYDARIRAKEIQAESQKAALRYERASSAHTVAKEMVHLAEEGLQKEGRTFDPAWQEMLNHATKRVNEAEIERVRSEREHQETSLAYNEAEQMVLHLHQELKRAIVKSSLSTRRSLLEINNLANQHQLQLLPYFEMKAQFNQMLEEQKRKVQQLEENVTKVKMSYSDALHNLEEISDEIHHRRKSKELQNQERGEGVGAESPLPSHHRIPYINDVKNERKQEQKQICRRSIETETDDIYLRLPDSLSAKTAILVNSFSSPSSIKSFDDGELPNTTNIQTDNLDSNRQIIISASALNSKEKTNQKLLNESKNGSHLDPTGHSQDSCSPSPSALSICDELDQSKYMGVNQLNTGDGNKSIQLFQEDKYIISSNGVFDRYETKTQDNNTVTNPNSPIIQSRKVSGADCNMLRIQKEDLSDTDSLASGGTADTLDDHQIECLLLDKFFEEDFQTLTNACEDLAINSDL
ncbi:SH3 domain-binding protein 5-like isoform X1 [Centruroides vittatus]|uniref:SH3 domain-binding protein 5-like isoform X1 n=1 Tax=Centruroides vittatus TaxID=120091 RepID=UPI00350FF9EB